MEQETCSNGKRGEREKSIEETNFHNKQ